MARTGARQCLWATWAVACMVTTSLRYASTAETNCNAECLTCSDGQPDVCTSCRSGDMLATCTKGAAVIARWEFHYTAGVMLKDSSGNDYWGTLKGHNATLVHPGVFGTGVTLGNDSYISIPHLPLESTSFTIAAHVFPSAMISTGAEMGMEYIFSDWAEPHGFRLALNKTVPRHILAEVHTAGGGVAKVVTAHSSVKLEEWQHIAMTWNKLNARLRVYVDGVLQGEDSVPNAGSDVRMVDGGHARFQIGRNENHRHTIDSHFDGSLDNVIVFSDVVDQGSLGTLMQKGSIDCMDNAGKINTCKPCEIPCAECFGVQTNCTACMPGRFYSDGGQCVKECGLGLFGDVSGGVCAACAPECRMCADGAHRCLECTSAYSLIGHQCVTQCPHGSFSHLNKCILDCPKEYYKNETDNTCRNSQTGLVDKMGHDTHTGTPNNLDPGSSGLSVVITLLIVGVIAAPVVIVVVSGFVYARRRARRLQASGPTNAYQVQMLPMQRQRSLVL